MGVNSVYVDKLFLPKMVKKPSLKLEFDVERDFVFRNGCKDERIKLLGFGPQLIDLFRTNLKSSFVMTGKGFTHYLKISARISYIKSNNDTDASLFLMYKFKLRRKGKTILAFTNGKIEIKRFKGIDDKLLMYKCSLKERDANLAFSKVIGIMMTDIASKINRFSGGFSAVGLE